LQQPYHNITHPQRRSFAGQPGIYKGRRTSFLGKQVARTKAIRRRLARAIEPLIAAIILIAITLVIAIAVTGWMMGVFTTSTAEQEKLVILPNATLKKSGQNGLLNITANNIGSVSIRIIGVFVGNYTCGGAAGDTPTLPYELAPGASIRIDATCTNLNPIPGASYNVRVITASGNVFATQVVATT